MRLFIAVCLPDRVLRPFGEFLYQLKPLLPRARWVCSQQSHLTLVFLGEVGPSRVEELKTIMQNATLNVSAFDLTFGGLGAFPSWNAPRVLWVGVRHGERELKSLAQGLSENLMARGYPQEERSFHPHLTLCRLSSSHVPEAFRVSATQKLDAQAWPAIPSSVDALSLIESQLTPRGPLYTVVHRAEFGRTNHS